VNGWYGVDLDGTLAQYDGWQGPHHIGPPVPAMLARVKRWLAAGCEVRIMTARVSIPAQARAAGREPTVAELAEHRAAVAAIDNWCLTHVGVVLESTCFKDFGMRELWDDRAVQVEANTGRRMDGEPEPEGPA
jgi:hypothetical protein